MLTRYFQLLHHGIQGRPWHSKTSCRKADHATGLAENAQDVIPLYFFQSGSASAFPKLTRAVCSVSLEGLVTTFQRADSRIGAANDPLRDR
jgi:hypothetical protein